MSDGEAQIIRKGLQTYEKDSCDRAGSGYGAGYDPRYVCGYHQDRRR